MGTKLNVLDKNGRLTMGYNSGKCVAVRSHYLNGKDKPASRHSKAVIENCDKDNIHQTFVQHYIDVDDQFFLCHKPLYKKQERKSEEDRAYWCLFNKKNYLKFGRVPNIEKPEYDFRWVHTDEGRLMNLRRKAPLG